MERSDILQAARSWLKTPYVHQASVKGVGCDCLGLLRGVWKDVFNEEAEMPPAYTAIWAEITPDGSEPMLEAAQRHLTQIPRSQAKPGDVFLVRIRNNSAVKHCGILSENGYIIHAYDRHDVVEEPMRVNWHNRDLFTFKFPGVVN